MNDVGRSVVNVVASQRQCEASAPPFEQAKIKALWEEHQRRRPEKKSFQQALWRFLFGTDWRGSWFRRTVFVVFVLLTPTLYGLLLLRGSASELLMSNGLRAKVNFFKANILLTMPDGSKLSGRIFPTNLTTSVEDPTRYFFSILATGTRSNGVLAEIRGLLDLKTKVKLPLSKPPFRVPSEVILDLALNLESPDDEGLPGLQAPPSVKVYAEWARPTEVAQYITFLQTSKDRLNAKYRLQQMFENSSPDSEILAVIRELNDISQMTNDVYWAEAPTSFAHPALGIAISRSEFETLGSKFRQGEFPMMLRFTLAHEISHRRVQLASTLDDASRQSIRARELQADILAAETLVWSALRRTREGDTNVSLLAPNAEMIATNREVNVWLDVSNIIGRHSGAYPRAEQRAAAISYGLLGGWRYFDIALARSRRNKGNEDGAQKVLERIIKKKSDVQNPDLLPRYDPEKLTYEGDLAWSHRVAQWIVEQLPR